MTIYYNESYVDDIEIEYPLSPIIEVSLTYRVKRTGLITTDLRYDICHVIQKTLEYRFTRTVTLSRPLVEWIPSSATINYNDQGTYTVNNLYGSNNNAYAKFNVNTVPSRTLPWTLQYDYGYGGQKQVTRYVMHYPNGFTGSDIFPKSWVFEGSLNGTTWTALDTQTSQTFSVTRTIDFVNNKAYRYYRLRVTEHWSPASPKDLYIGRVKLYDQGSTLLEYAIYTASLEADTYAGVAPINVTFTITDESLPSLPRYHWDFGDGTSGYSTTPTARKQYLNAGTFTVSVSVPNLEYLPVASVVVTITERPAGPHAMFFANPVMGIAPLNVQFENISVYTGAVTWDWNFGDGTDHSAEKNPLHTYTGGATYNVSLTVTDSDGNDTLTRVNYIHGSVVPPSANFEIASGNATVTYGEGIWVELKVTDSLGNTSSITMNVLLDDEEDRFIEFRNTSTGDIVECRWTYGDLS